MKKDIHPKYYEKAKVTCACGATFETGSVDPEINIEICSMCHPFYTGNQKLIDTAGRVDRFRARLEKSAKKKAEVKVKDKKLIKDVFDKKAAPATPKRSDGGQGDK